MGLAAVSTAVVPPPPPRLGIKLSAALPEAKAELAVTREALPLVRAWPAREADKDPLAKAALAVL